MSNFGVNCYQIVYHLILLKINVIQIIVFLNSPIALFHAFDPLTPEGLTIRGLKLRDSMKLVLEEFSSDFLSRFILLNTDTFELITSIDITCVFVFIAYIAHSFYLLLKSEAYFDG